MRQRKYRTFAPTRLNPLLRHHFASIFGNYRTTPVRPTPITLSEDRALFLEWNRQARVTALLAQQSRISSSEN
jgi:hypothetical protein